MEDRGWRMEERWRIEDRRSRMEDGRWKIEDGIGWNERITPRVEDGVVE
jgi:hypothetical protein